MKKIRVSIDSVQLKGFRHSDRFEVVEGLKLELARTLSNLTVTERVYAPGRIPLLRLGQIQMETGIAPRQVGMRLGGAVARRISR